MGLYQPAILKEWFELNINEFKEFFCFMETSIKGPEGRHVKRYQDLIKGLSGKDKEEFESFYEDEFYQYSQYRRRLNVSFLVAIFSFLESSMNSICRNIEKIKEDKEIRIKLNDIKDTGIDRAKIYLTKIAGCSDSLFNSSAWQEIKILQYIRNALVHNEGNIPKGNKGEVLKKYIADKPDYFVHKNIELDLDTYRNHIPILAKKEYCLFSLDNIGTFLEQLLKDINWQ